MYYLIIQEGMVFEGSLSDFEERFFSFPEDSSQEEILESIKFWVEDNGWTFDYGILN